MTPDQKIKLYYILRVWFERKKSEKTPAPTSDVIL